jgi:hypothetical protein
MSCQWTWQHRNRVTHLGGGSNACLFFIHDNDLCPIAWFVHLCADCYTICVIFCTIFFHVHVFHFCTHCFLLHLHTTSNMHCCVISWKFIPVRFLLLFVIILSQFYVSCNSWYKNVPVSKRQISRGWHSSWLFCWLIYCPFHLDMLVPTCGIGIEYDQCYQYVSNLDEA